MRHAGFGAILALLALVLPILPAQNASRPDTRSSVPSPADEADTDQAAEPARPDDVAVAGGVPSGAADATSAEEVSGGAAAPVVTGQAVNDADLMDDPRATDSPTER